MQDQKQTILNFLKSHNLAVIATSSNGQPEAAAIDFSETTDLEIIFTTLSAYRKYKNLSQNPKVALVIGGGENITVQYEGEARELFLREFEPYVQYHNRKNPIEAKFAAMPEARFFKIKPTWIRYADYAANPNNIFEIKF